MLRITGFLIAILFSTLAQAHHSTAGIYDINQIIKVTGTITKISWRNPHGEILFDVEDETGNIVEWSVETAAISLLRNKGMNTDAVAVGDVVTIAGQASRRNQPRMFGSSMLLPNGFEFSFSAMKPHFQEGRDGKLLGSVALDTNINEAKASADGIFRVWSTIMTDPAAFPIFKGGYPLSDEGKRKFAEWNPRDNVLFQCNKKGTPLIMITPLPIEFKHQGKDILINIEENDAERLIHMSADAVAPEEHSQFGFSRGRWQGTTLVVETDHITAGYFDHIGAQQSDQISIVEYFTPNAAYDRMDYRMTVTDPIMFTETFELTRYFVWKPEMSVHDYECLERY